MIKKVFIIGAGSNVNLDFPTGIGLREAILNGDCEYISKNYFPTYKQFLKDFRFSRNHSIDRYIERNQEFAELGKFLITYYISKKETNALQKLDSDVFPDNWYFDLFNKVLDRFTDLDEQIIFVSFNYDRALEFYIRTAIDKTFIQPISFSTTADQDKFHQLKKKLNDRFVFEYVYGKIGSLEDNPFGRELGYENLNIISKGINLITDERKDELSSIRKHLSSANLIYIIGFGFDKTNAEYIGLNSENITAKAIFATSFNIGLAERLRIYNSFPTSHRHLIKFYNPQRNITQFLRDLYLSGFSDTDVVQLKERTLHPEDIPIVKLFKS